MGDTEKKPNYALKAIFSTANLKGTAAVCLSIAMGTPLASTLYAGAVLIGTHNKYRSLSKETTTHALTSPSITAKIFMAAASYNVIDSGLDIFSGPAEFQTYNALRTTAWLCGFFGDNALRNLDDVNFSQSKDLRKPVPSKLRDTFNTLVANPTIFYSGTSAAFTLAILANGPVHWLYSLEGAIGTSAIALFSLGIAHAIRKTWQATTGEISTDKINDGVMNTLAATAKAGQCVLALMTGHYWFAAAQAIFSGSSVKLLFETREALEGDRGENRKKKDNTNKPDTPPNLSASL